MKSYIMLVKMAIIKKTRDKKCSRGCGGKKRNFIELLLGL